MKKILELDNDRVVKVDSISDKSFTDMVVKQADTPNQLIPSAVPNKSQGNGIVIPERAKLTFSPESEDLLRTKSLVGEMLFYKVVPNSLLVQTREKQAAGSC